MIPEPNSLMDFSLRERHFSSDDLWVLLISVAKRTELDFFRPNWSVGRNALISIFWENSPLRLRRV